MANNRESGGGRPVIGIAPDVSEPRPGSVRAGGPVPYARAVWAAGGWPVVLIPVVGMIGEHLERCDGIVLTGGDDPRTEAFGEPTHPKATPVHPERQAFDEALLRALEDRADMPVLGVCLGMQMMALAAGGRLDQYLPETLATAERHWESRRHGVRGVASGVLMAEGEAGEVASHHRQAVREPGRLRVCAVSEDGVIEAIDAPGRAFYAGVQWHPERTGAGSFGVGVFEKMVKAAKRGG